MPYRQHLKSALDLVTTPEQIRAGFVSLALERNRRSTPHVEAARALKVAALNAESPAGLKGIRSIQSALLTAAGISDKAAAYMLPKDKQEAIQGLIANFLEPAGHAFVEELVFRFLLTRGDTLGGTMRNTGGALAQRKLTRGLISSLTLNAIHYRWLHSASRTWIEMTEDDADIELNVCGLAWILSGKTRTLMYNVTVPVVRNNIDLILLNCTPEEYSDAYQDPSRYLALGELKGGIDPGGADEHWKTAKTALARIRSAFEEKAITPMTFFVGAAVAKKMADEIWNDLQKNLLSNSANLTNPDHLAALCNWITQI